MVVNEDDFLEHFGKKGMKWGVRKEIRKTDSEQKINKGKKFATALLITAGAIKIGLFAMKLRTDYHIDDGGMIQRNDPTRQIDYINGFLRDRRL